MGLLNTVTGHARPKRILLSSLGRGRIATTYLFTGESGIGKRLAALEFAKAVNCLDPVRDGADRLDACDRCSSCRRFASGTHPDLLMVGPRGGTIRIEAVREVQEFLSFTAYEAERKVVLMDDAECMNLPASNAFLKTLEEPPAKSLIILVTMSAERLTDTIRSRCFRVRFSPLNREETLEVIRRNLPGADEETLESLAGLSMGRPGLALREEGTLLRETLGGMVRGVAGGGIEVDWNDREEMEAWLNLFTVVLRELMVLKLAPSERRLLLGGRLSEGLAAAAGGTDLQELTRLYSELTALARHLGFNLSRPITANYVRSLIDAGIKGRGRGR